jgi:mono/diheme cytochrome c family protein
MLLTLLGSISIILVFGVVSLLGACAQPAPAPAPTPLPPSSIDAGELFASNCASCHGTNRGGSIGPALIPEALATLSDSEVKSTILNGRQGTLPNGRQGTLMPAWNDLLTDEEIDALIQLVKYTSS